MRQQPAAADRESAADAFTVVGKQDRDSRAIGYGRERRERSGAIVRRSGQRLLEHVVAMIW